MFGRRNKIEEQRRLRKLFFPTLVRLPLSAVLAKIYYLAPAQFSPRLEQGVSIGIDVSSDDKTLRRGPSKDGSLGDYSFFCLVSQLRIKVLLEI